MEYLEYLPVIGGFYLALGALGLVDRRGTAAVWDWRWRKDRHSVNEICIGTAYVVVYAVLRLVILAHS